MNKQRKVVITTTYNEMGIIIDTKAEEVAQPNLQPTCNQLATDCISRQAAIDEVHKNYDTILDFKSDGRTVADSFEDIINALPPEQPEQRWIPRSERCPVKEGRYLATMHPTYSHDIDIEIVCWSGRWSRWVGYDEREILAWMPLPKPYMEEEE